MSAQQRAPEASQTRVGGFGGWLLTLSLPLPSKGSGAAMLLQAPDQRLLAGEYPVSRSSEATAPRNHGPFDADAARCADQVPEDRLLARDHEDDADFIARNISARTLAASACGFRGAKVRAFTRFRKDGKKA